MVGILEKSMAYESGGQIYIFNTCTQKLSDINGRPVAVAYYINIDAAGTWYIDYRVGFPSDRTRDFSSQWNLGSIGSMWVGTALPGEYYNVVGMYKTLGATLR